MFGSIVISRNPIPGLREAASKQLKKSRRFLITSGALLCATGIIALILPSAAGIGVNLLIAWLLTLLGIAGIVSSITGEAKGSRWQSMALGIVAAVIGLFMIFQPYSGTIAITALLAAYFIVDSLMGMITAFQARGTLMLGTLVTASALSLILGVIILSFLPEAAPWLLGVLLGLHLLADGIFSLLLASKLKEQSKLA